MTSPFPQTDLVAIRRDVPRPAPQRLARPRLVIVGESVGAVPIYMPYAPKAVDHGEWGGDYVQINRPGLPDAIQFISAKLPQWSGQFLIVDKFNATRRSLVTAVSVISALKKYSEEGTRVRVTYGTFESGLFYLTNMALSSVERDMHTDEITQAVMDITFIKSGDLQDSTGPITGGVKPPTPPKPKPDAQKTSSRYYEVKRGDTLWAISIHFYGTGVQWRSIADANGIKDPRKLQIGTILRIP